ncbi:hypothetical protein BD779DRAFT_1722970 [Infundibulicybe gibba]|nr:hypothetical protein BD779DRAFT_1722970 [Infundibulicybe gibba]
MVQGIYIYRIYSLGHKIFLLVACLLASSALLDVILTVSMCLQLRKNRLDGLKRTIHIVDTLTRWTIESGMVTSIIAIIALIVWQVDQESSKAIFGTTFMANLTISIDLWIGLGICLTSCYALTLMGLMNGRTLLNTPREFTLNSIPITTMQFDHHLRVSRPPPAEC